MTPAELIEEHIRLDDYLKSEAKRFNAFMAPSKQRMEAIENELLAALNEMTKNSSPEDQAKASFSCNAGTAYKSNILNIKLDPEGTEEYSGETGRDAFLSYVLDNWETFGNEMLLFQPQKDAVKKHIEESGRPPPGVKTSWYTRVNIRRS